MDDIQLIDELVERSKKAQESFANASQEQADAAARAFCKVIYDYAEPLAQMAVEETQMGNYQDKILKNQTKSKLIWNDLRGKKSAGTLREIPEKNITEVAKPMGVVCSIAPCTNPIVTPMSNCAFALKCRNSVIIAPHPRAKLCTRTVVKLFRTELKHLGLPEDLVLSIEEPSVNLSNLLMQKADVIIATGGMGMVRAAYSSGKPAYGVGSGNVQCILDEGIDYDNTVEKVVTGRTFDNGIICLAEQSVIYPKKARDKVYDALLEKGTYLITDKEQADILRETLFPQGKAFNKQAAGQPAAVIARLAGISVPEKTRALAVPAMGTGAADVLTREKMCPVLALFEYEEFHQGVNIAHQNLMCEGKGHSASLHSVHAEHIAYAQEILPVSRLIINQAAGTTGGGSWNNGYTPTTTLGCGTWGNNSISDNFSYTYLMNITRVGYPIEQFEIPEADQIWS